MRFFRIFTVFTLLAGFFTLFQAIRLYQSPSIIVEWSTASELDVAGFNILRGDHPDGPFTQINDSLIPPSEDALTGGDYTFEDSQVEGGHTYYYQLQEVELSGSVALQGQTESKAVRGGLLEAILAGVLILGSILILTNKNGK
jgi:hypothetical protein